MLPIAFGWSALKSREGVIIELPLNGLFHDARDVFLTSLMGVRELER